MDMTLNDILTAISTVGFPIIACVGLFWLYTKMLPILTGLSDNTKEMKEMLDSIKSTLDLFNQNFVNIFSRLSILEATSDNQTKGKHSNDQD